LKEVCCFLLLLLFFVWLDGPNLKMACVCTHFQLAGTQLQLVTSPFIGHRLMSDKTVSA
jgi:hypothetical protein